MRALHVTSYRRYGDVLDSDPAEYPRLLDTLTINVTEFFRDSEMWSSLRRNVLPELIERKRESRNRAIRIWSAGCATGEEPYSVTMMLLDMLGTEAHKFNVSVLASDIDPSAIARAKQGVYDKAKARNLPADYRLRFTRPTGSTHFTMADEVRDVVRFRKMSLFDDIPVKVIDLVLCRNVFIYFDREQQARVLANFDRAMSPGGYLVLGRSEKLSDVASTLLEPVDGNERIYRKRGRT
jgi:chemotaxis methyl-accepting protein methylase